MFSRSISELKPWTDRGMFENVTGRGYRGGYGDNDIATIAAAKAIFSRRLGDGETISIKIENIPHDHIPEDMAEVLTDIALRATVGESNTGTLKNTIIVSQALNMSADDWEKTKANIESQFVSLNPNWRIHEKAEAFLGKEVSVRVLYNKENRSAYMIINKLSVPYWHFLGSMFPACVPAVFENEPLNEKEKAVLKALAIHGSNRFIEAMTDLEEYYDIRGKRIRAMVGGFEKNERAHQVEVVDNEIDQILRQMGDLMRRYDECVIKKDEANIRRAGLKYILESTEDDDSLVKFFEANKCLDVVDVSGARISFIVRTFYENFDPDEYERFRENDGFFSEMLTGDGVFNDIENCRKVLDAMFLNGTLRMKMCAFFRLDIRGSVSTESGYTFPPNCADYIQNYHLDHHMCFGNYEAVITDYLSKADTIGAINACIASAKSVNIAESGATFNPMMHRVFTTHKKCFVLPDGTSVTPVKALEWLNEQEQKGDA